MVENDCIDFIGFLFIFYLSFPLRVDPLLLLPPLLLPELGAGLDGAGAGAGVYEGVVLLEEPDGVQPRPVPPLLPEPPEAGDSE
jgi:hypothetical protein